MLFNGDNLTCLFCRCNYKFFIKRLDCGNVNDFSIDSLCFKSFACFNCFINHKSVCDDRYIAALFDNFAFADFKFIIIIVKYRHCKSAESKVNRAFIFVGCFNCLPCFNIICRADNYHSRN